MYHVIIICLMYLLAVPTAWSQSHERPENAVAPVVLQWGFINLPPLIYQGEDGKPKGILAEIMAGASQHSNIPYESIEFPNARAIYNLNEQKVNFGIGVTSMVKNPSDFIISAFPIAKMQLNIVWLKSSQNVTSIEDLTGKRLVLLAGYTYGGLRSKLEKIASGYVEVETHERAIGALKLNRGNYALTYKTASALSIPKEEELGFANLVVADIDVHFILSASVPQAEVVMQRLEAGFLAYQQSQFVIHEEVVPE